MYVRAVNIIVDTQLRYQRRYRVMWRKAAAHITVRGVGIFDRPCKVACVLATQVTYSSRRKRRWRNSKLWEFRDEMQEDVEPRKKSSVALLTDQPQRTSSPMASCTHLVPFKIALRRARSALAHEIIESTTSGLSPVAKRTRQSEKTRSAWNLAQQVSS